MESLDGVLTQVRSHKTGKWNPAGTPYLIGQLLNGITVKGEMLKPIQGENYRFWGSMMPQKGNWPDAFEFSSYEVIIDETETGVSLYLINYVAGLGIAKASALVDHFGSETLAILRATPEKALEVKGITQSIVDSIRRHFDEEVRIDPVAFAALTDLFAGFKISRKTITQIVKDFGSSTIDSIKALPYTILLSYPRMGWKTVDNFARMKLDYPEDGPDRHAAAIVECLEQIGGQGHTYGERVEINEISHKIMGSLPNSIGWAHALSQGLIVADTLDQREDDYAERAAIDSGVQSEDAEAYSLQIILNLLDHVYFRPGVKFMLPKIAEAENCIAKRLITIANAVDPLDAMIDTKGLNVDQTLATEIIPDNGVSLLVGGPGTGKTFTICRVIAGFVNQGITNIRCAAPTGKAAKRSAEVLAQALPGVTIPCTTIHKALCPEPSTEKPGAPSSSAKINRGREAFGFARNEANPLEEQVIVIDETSMVDVQLAASFLRAVAPGTRLVFVGDQHQLPSVGAGSFLRDMLDAGVPSAGLSEIVRSESAGRIVHACHAIKDGLLPVPAATVSLPVDNWIHVEFESQAEIAEWIVQFIEPKKTFTDPIWDFQVVTPQRGKLPTACANLNRLLSNKLNPRDPAEGDEVETQQADDGSFEPSVRPGDKVVRTKNGIADEMIECTSDADEIDLRWRKKKWSFQETDIVNGDMGTVEDIVYGDSKPYCVVRFRTPDRLVRLMMSDHHLSLAYAMTCHKAQGSGFPVVIVPVHEAFYWDERTKTGIFNREWIYTAVSRAEKLLITVGQANAIRAAVSRKTVHRRRTRLVELIRREMKQAEELLPGEEAAKVLEEVGSCGAQKTKQATKEEPFLNWKQIQATMKLSGITATPDQLDKLKSNYEQIGAARWFVNLVGIDRARELISLIEEQNKDK